MLGKKCLNTFQKTDRILKRTEFLDISQTGKKVRNRQFIALYVRKKEEKPRLGITVTKKVGKAATRNKIKRRIREFFRNNRQKLPSNVDINIIATKEAVKMDAKETFSSLDNIFEKIACQASKSG